MNAILDAIHSEATCGEACWAAREDVCRCSCGGRNHGIARTGGVAERTAKIDGYRYRLIAVGSETDINHRFDALVADYPPKEHHKFTTYDGRLISYTYPWGKHDHRSPWRVKAAGKDQIARWPELAPYRQDRWGPYLLWAYID